MILFIEGFIIKVLASFDDTLTRIPLIAALTRTKMGKVAFAIGSLLSEIVAIVIVMIFTEFIRDIPFIKYIISFIIVIFALLVYFDIFVSKSREKTEEKIVKIKSLSTQRFFQLVVLGFLISFITVLDDILVFVPLFIHENINKMIPALGIIVATLIQLILVFYFGHKMKDFKYKKEIAAIALVVLAILVAGNII